MVCAVADQVDYIFAGAGPIADESKLRSIQCSPQIVIEKQLLL